MKSALDVNKVSTLSAVLLTNLDEGIFFSRLSAFVMDQFNEYKVQVFEASQDGETFLRAENDKAIEDGLEYKKGMGLSGYVVRTKRAYYSNSPRDPLLATTKRDDCVQSELCVPINADGIILGTINIQSSNEDRKFSEEDVVVVLEILNNIASAVNNMKLYLLAKNLNKELQETIKQKEEELQSRGPAMRSGSGSHIQDVEMIGHANSFTQVLDTAKKVACEDFPILIVGDSGTGKKSLAKKIHLLSDRKERACSVVHCSAIDEAKLDIELFGSKDRPGVIQRTNGGTIILESIENLTLNIQAKILRLMISGEMYMTDSNIPTAVNVRFISITRGSLDKLVEENKFQEELLYRLNLMSIKMPSLKERKEDIKLLSEYFLNKVSTGAGKVMTSKAIDRLSAYSWPGNIHELKNLMERTSILVSEQFIDEAHLPELAREDEVEEVVVEDFSEMTLHSLERIHICKTLDHLGGNKTRAAKSLGITVKTLYNKLHSYGLVNPKAE